MNTSLNIVELIENNPITRLSGTYQHKLLNKIKASFTDNEQQLFVASFYCYIKYDQRNDFVIDLDDVWKWVGFSQKYNAKHMLEKQFFIDIDYKIIAPEPSGAKKDIRGGHNKETIMLTINKNGKIVSKKKCIQATIDNRFIKHGINLPCTNKDIIV